MTDQEMREAARQFFYKWTGKGREDEDARSYWIEILTNIFGVDHVTDRVEFEKKLVGADKNTKRIDVYIPETRVLIEQKSLGIPLDKPQAGHNGQTPYEQAKYYDNYLPFNEKARWIITSNFAEIWIYDMNARVPEPVKLTLSELQAKYHLLDILVNREKKKLNEEMQISLKAGELVGKLYDAFLARYKNPNDPGTLASLNVLCVRIVFCLYAEDAGIFGRKNMFHDYMAQFDAKSARKGLRDLFRVLDQKIADRDEYLSDDDPLLAAFPYVNGGLFSDENIEIPPFTDEIMSLILREASDNFDWSGISPTIFGAVFESTLNPETRRSGGMHYTSIENIHKVIDPLFLDDLKAEFAEIKKITVMRTREKKLRDFQEKLAGLHFLDPAAGSGNFLTESYTSLRKLENEVIRELSGGQISFGEVLNPVKVSISQFYGIEINDFAVTVAKTALWIAESQMLKETEDIVRMTLDFLPLKTNANIVEGNALRIDWESVVEKEKLSYVMGNPPFVGYAYQNSEQKDDLRNICPGAKNVDYVSGWYFKAAEYMKNTSIKTAFVSTNSITQGEQVVALWKPLMNNYDVTIMFAYQTFRWDSEASIKAHVHCIIVGFCSGVYTEKKRLFNKNGVESKVDNINGYLAAASSVFIEKRTTPISEVSRMHRGSQPTDDGNFIMSKEERDEILRHDPDLNSLIRPYMSGRDFINRTPRYCFWLKNATPSQIKDSRELLQRIDNVRQFRLKSTKAATRAKASTPTLFDEDQQPTTDFVAIPKVSSERRRYIPIEFMHPETVVADLIYVIEDAEIYHFGVMTSNVHMSWMRAVCGRLKSDYRYSNTIVYNNFPWPSPTPEQKAKIEQTAQGILDARALYPDASLADLYDELTMPPELRRAHQLNDKAVMQAYGMPIKETTEESCVAWLMRLYQEKVAEKG